ncbi:helix-turn-helix transcriptional regulator [Staphylococcus gallinarum]|uniref:helix-turn-helix domain-containing protein n=1 Tax=Staphylococcus gallinarum TaxID=1293 RepID=UPI001E32B061|nr:helix-turn-helix transcriptional regulator [Staphylococcus gallinarum]MCD8911216.1 helix-turn-helix transcriptional regulator [Staphylococcus gallinarum]
MIKFDLKKVMKQKKVNISQLHEMTGISRNSLSLLINGKSQGIQFETIEKITKALNVDINNLFKNIFDYVSINVTGIKTAKGHFPSMRDNIKIKEEIEIMKDNNYSQYSFKVLDCSFIEDGIEKREYIPYRILTDITGSNQILVDVNIEKSALANEFKRVFDVSFDEIIIRKIVNIYFIDKILQYENLLFKELLNTHSFPLNKLRLSSYLQGLEISPSFFMSISVDLPNDLKINLNKELLEDLERLNNKSDYKYEYEKHITISNINK